MKEQTGTCTGFAKRANLLKVIEGIKPVRVLSFISIEAAWLVFKQTNIKDKVLKEKQHFKHQDILNVIAYRTKFWNKESSDFTCSLKRAHNSALISKLYNKCNLKNIKTEYNAWNDLE